MKIRIDDAAVLKEIRELQIAAVTLPEDIVRKLVAEGMRQAKSLAGATSPELAGSIMAAPMVRGILGVTGGFGINLDFAPYVEYGTGRPGAAGDVANDETRNPAAGGFTYTFETIIKEGPQAGNIRQGWVYYDEERERFFHTLGQPASPFMYPAAQLVSELAGDLAQAVVHDTIGGL